ncbi:hypothetical protein, partial [Nocardia sienata]|uniref:hypothetical protein n=1 Tax=Nocardia sienata TaxID=248552 RepID=UPI000AFF91F4
MAWASGSEDADSEPAVAASGVSGPVADGESVAPVAGARSVFSADIGPAIRGVGAGSLFPA